MTTHQKAICVYGASCEDIAEKYKKAAFETGRLTAEAGASLVSGGGRAGLMRCAIDGALSASGTTIGVLPQFMTERGWQHPQLTRMIVEPDMHSRKATMARLSSAVIAMPGGVGTLDELMEIITWRQLGIYQGRVVILNTDGYFDPLLQMLDRIASEGFMRSSDSTLWYVASTPDEAVMTALKEE